MAIKVFYYLLKIFFLRYSPDSELVQRLVKVLDEQFFNLDNNLYAATAMEIIASLYQVNFSVKNY